MWCNDKYSMGSYGGPWEPVTKLTWENEMLNENWVASHSGVKMPAIIYGTAWKKEHTRDLVINALQAGFKGIDTAGQPRHYK